MYESLPPQYKWLTEQPTTRMVAAWVSIYGLKEIPGERNSPDILQLAKDLKIEKIYSSDAIPWCGLGMAWVAKKANKTLPKNFLSALSWREFGRRVRIPMLGDVLIYRRGQSWQGHVCTYIGEDDEAYHVIGANQSDKVCIVRKLKRDLYVARRPIYKTQPVTVRRVFLAPHGELSRKEQ